MKSSIRKTAAVCAALLTLGAVVAAYGEGGNGVGTMEYLDRGVYAVKS